MKAISWPAPLSLLAWYLLAVNILAFIVFGLDKLFAIRRWRRMPEATLLLLAILGGTIGELIAMTLFRHKTLHKKFFLGIPIIFILQIAAIVYFGLIQ